MRPIQVLTLAVFFTFLTGCSADSLLGPQNEGVFHVDGTSGHNVDGTSGHNVDGTSGHN